MPSFSHGTRFRPGQSGNPLGGRTMAHQLSTYVRSLAGQDGRAYIDKLHELALGPHRDNKVRLAAITLLLNYGWGKPKETVALEGDVEALPLTPAVLSRLSDAELEQAVAIGRRLREVVAEAVGRLTPSHQGVI